MRSVSTTGAAATAAEQTPCLAPKPPPASRPADYPFTDAGRAVPKLTRDCSVAEVLVSSGTPEEAKVIATNLRAFGAPSRAVGGGVKTLLATPKQKPENALAGLPSFSQHPQSPQARARLPIRLGARFVDVRIQIYRRHLGRRAWFLEPRKRQIAQAAYGPEAVCPQLRIGVSALRVVAAKACADRPICRSHSNSKASRGRSRALAAPRMRRSPSTIARLIWVAAVGVRTGRRVRCCSWPTSTSWSFRDA